MRDDQPCQPSIALYMALQGGVWGGRGDVWHCTALNISWLSDTALSIRKIARYCTVLYCTVLYCTVLYPYEDERRDIRSNIPLRLKKFPRANGNESLVNLIEN